METKKTELNLDFTKPFSLEITSGDIFISHAEGSPFISIEYTPFGNIQPEIIIESNEKNSITFKNSEIIKTNVILNIPKNINEIDIHSVNGSISIGNIEGGIKLQADKGDLKIEGCSGKLAGTAFSGDIKINGHNGRLDLSANIGNIRIIGWDSASGSLLSSNGKVLLGLKKIADSIKINSNNGDISIGLSNDSSCNITARAVEIINYLDGPLNGKKLGNLASIAYKNGNIKVEALSANRKIFIAKNEDLKDISPDMEEILNELESSFKESFKSFSKIMEGMGKKLSKTISTVFAESVKTGGTKNTSNDALKNERLEILQMLKDGKITAEEAEKLLKALK